MILVMMLLKHTKCSRIVVYIQDFQNQPRIPKLFQLVETYQQHKHSKISPQKIQHTTCRFHVGRYFGEESIISISLPISLKEQEKTHIMDSRNIVFSKVKEHIDGKVDPAKINFYDHTREDFRKVKPNERTRNIRSRLWKCIVCFK